MFDIIVIGSSTRDVFVKSEGQKVVKDPDFVTGQGQCFPLGSKIGIKKLVFTTGGGGANAAVTFARQGLNTACIGVIGKDFNAKRPRFPRKAWTFRIFRNTTTTTRLTR